MGLKTQNSNKMLKTKMLLETRILINITIIVVSNNYFYCTFYKNTRTLQLSLVKAKVNPKNKTIRKLKNR